MHAFEALITIYSHLSMTITRNKNPRSTINQILGMFFSLLCMSFLFFIGYFVYATIEIRRSGWYDLEKSFAYKEEVSYQAGKHILTLQNGNRAKQEFYVKLDILKGSGIYFSAPIKACASDGCNDIQFYSAAPLFIPWDAFSSCEKGSEFNNFTQVRFYMKNLDIALTLNNWNELKNLCIEKGLAVP